MKASIKHRYQKEKKSTLKWVKVVCVCACAWGGWGREVCVTHASSGPPNSNSLDITGKPYKDLLMAEVLS